MKQVLVLGAGLVARPLIGYLLSQPDVRLTVATRSRNETYAAVAAHPQGRPLLLDVENIDELGERIAACDLAISMLPYLFHVAAADLCIRHGKPLVTTSYVSDAMQARDEAARKAGVLILNELGLDPGIDHMSAMRIIDGVKGAGGKITSFTSYCGGLPANDSNDNPFGYKFSWSPRGVLLAGRNDARFLKDGATVEIAREDLFDHHWPVEVPGVGTLEGYPNRNSVSYVRTYGLEGVRTMLRGTLRNVGWCRTLKALADLGALGLEPLADFNGSTWAEWTAHLAGVKTTENLRDRLSERLRLADHPDVLDRFEWLGLLSGEALPADEDEPLDVLCHLMKKKLAYRPGERDQIILFHEFFAEYADRKERITSVLVEEGIPGGASAMSRTVGLPAAIGAKLILEGKIGMVGVHKPVHAEIYDPILDELESMGIAFREERTAVE